MTILRMTNLIILNTDHLSTTDTFVPQNVQILVSLVIRGRYVPSFWTVNLEFADKKAIFDWKIVIFSIFVNAI
jgi:hypothetical protein